MNFNKKETTVHFSKVAAKKIYLSVIIPAYNEVERIETVLRSVDMYLGNKNYDYEIIVVNDGSTDKTEMVVKKLARDIKHLKIVSIFPNKGKGFAVQQGMFASTGLFKLFMDADNSTTIDNLDVLFPHIQEGNDIVIGSRRVRGARIEVRQNILRDTLGGAFRTLVSLMVPVDVVDTQNGFKLFSTRAANDIFRRQRTFTWAFDVEVLAIARLLGYGIKEAPIEWRNDGRSHVTFNGMMRMFQEVLEIRYNLATHLYDVPSVEEVRVG